MACCKVVPRTHSCFETEEGLLGTRCLSDAALGACAFAGEFAEDRSADDQRGSHQADGRHGLAQKGDGEDDGRKRLEVADDGDGLYGQFGDGAKVEQAAEISPVSRFSTMHIRHAP